MSWNTIKLDPADVAFSKYIRTKAGWKCVRCRRVYVPPTRALQASHFHSRRKETTRFDEDNVDSLCANCHRHFTYNRADYEAWKFDQLGKERYDLLTLRANTPGKKDRKMELIRIREMLKKLEANEVL